MCVLGFPTNTIFYPDSKVFIDEKRIHKKVAISRTETCFLQLYFNTVSVNLVLYFLKLYEQKLGLTFLVLLLYHSTESNSYHNTTIKMCMQ